MNADWCDYKGPKCWEYETFKLTAASKKFKHNFTIHSTCIRLAIMEAVQKFRAKHPGATDVTVTERN